MYKMKGVATIALCALAVAAKTVTLEDCEDKSLVKSAYANDKGITAYQTADNPRLVLNSWRC